MATIAISASKFIALAKSLYTTGRNIDARAQYLDVSVTPNILRDYLSTQEVLDYLSNATQSVQTLLRSGGFSVFVNTGGTRDSTTGQLTGGTRNEYWFKDGAADNNLVLKQANIDLSHYATTQSLNSAVAGLAAVGRTGNYTDLQGTPDLSAYVTGQQLANALPAGSYSFDFNNPRTQVQDYFKTAAQIKSIVLKSGIASYQYSLNGGSSWVTPSLPLAGNISIPADTVMLHRITYNVGLVTALLYIELA